MFLSNGLAIPPQTGTLGDVTPIFADASYYGTSAVHLEGLWAAYGAIYTTQLWVGIVVRKKAMATARMPFKVMRVGPDNKRTPLDNGPLAKLLAHPNERMSGFKLWQWTSSTRDVYGEAFWLKGRDQNGVVRELNPIHPRNMIVRRLPNGDVEYIYTSGARNVSMLPPIPAEDVVAFTGYNPDNLVRGVSNLESLRMTLLNEDAARRATSSFWQRGARPSMILSHPDSLSSGAQERLKQKAQATMGGADNMGGVSVFEEGIKAQIMQLSAEDMQYIESRKLNREEVCAAYDISPLVVHILDHATFSNVTEQLRSQYRDTMAPWFSELQADVDHQLVPDFYPKRDVMTQFDMSDVLRGDFEARTQATIALRANGIYTGNEARHVMGEQPIEDPLMDKVFANAAMQELGQPTEKVTVTGTTVPTPAEAAAVSDTAAAGAAEAAGADQGGKNFIRSLTGAASIRSLMGELSQTKGNLPAKREVLKAQVVRALNGYYADLHKAVLSDLRSGKLKTGAAAKLPGAYGDVTVGKGVKAAPVPEDTGPVSYAAPFDREVWDANLKQVLTALNVVIAKSIGTDVAASLDSNFDLERLEGWLEANADIASGRINDATAATLAQVFALETEDPAEVEQALAEAFSPGGEILGEVANRATERVAEAGNFSALETAGDSEADAKTWVVNSANPRPAHAARAGEQVLMGELFSGGMKYPGDYSGGADEVAGCTCTMDFSTAPNADPVEFHDNFESAMAGSPFDAFVNHYTAAEIAGMKNIILREGGKAGMLVNDHGDGRIEATALFNQSGNKDVGRQLMADSVNKYGVNYAECFGPVLPKIYEGVGFKTVEAYPFDPAQAPENWNSARFDSPDYHIMTVGGVPVDQLANQTAAAKSVRTKGGVPAAQYDLTQLEQARDAAFAEQSPEWVARYGDAAFEAAKALVGYDPMN